MMEQMTEMKDDMENGFDAVDKRFDDMNKELKYITHKIHALDREVFMRTDSLQ